MRASTAGFRPANTLGPASPAQIATTSTVGIAAVGRCRRKSQFTTVRPFNPRRRRQPVPCVMPMCSQSSSSTIDTAFGRGSSSAPPATIRINVSVGWPSADSNKRPAWVATRTRTAHSSSNTGLPGSKVARPVTHRTAHRTVTCSLFRRSPSSVTAATSRCRVFTRVTRWIPSAPTVTPQSTGRTSTPTS